MMLLVITLRKASFDLSKFIVEELKGVDIGNELKYVVNTSKPDLVEDKLVAFAETDPEFINRRSKADKASKRAPFTLENINC